MLQCTCTCSFRCSELHVVNNLFVCSQDEDRIFTNLYGRHDWKLPGAIKRVIIETFYDCKDIRRQM